MGYYIQNEAPGENLSGLGGAADILKSIKIKKARIVRVLASARKAGKSLTRSQKKYIKKQKRNIAILNKQLGAKKKRHKKAKKRKRIVKVAALVVGAVFAAPLILKGAKLAYGGAKSLLSAKKILPVAEKLSKLRKKKDVEPAGGYGAEPFYEELPSFKAAPVRRAIAPVAVEPVELVFTPEGLSRTKLFG